MRTYTIEKTVYNYNELSADAKEKAKEWYLQGQDPEWYEEDILNDLSAIFPKSDLKVQFSLSACQGDGLNIYGSLNIYDAIEYIKSDLSADEIKFLKWVAKVSYRDIELAYNNRYCYSLKTHYNLLEDIELELENDGYKNIKWNILHHFEKLLTNTLFALDNEYEKNGYTFFYEISDKDMSEACNCNGYEFFEDGTAA